MSAVKDCPKCGLVNPPTAQRCDCGYDFVSRDMEASYLGKEGTSTAMTQMEGAICLLIPVFGIVLGFQAKSQGRRKAGNMMLLASGLMMFVPLLIFGLFLLTR